MGVLSEDQLRAVVAEQEEHIKRTTVCNQKALVPHRWGQSDGPWAHCVVCGVTKTREDYAMKLVAQSFGIA